MLELLRRITPVMWAGLVLLVLLAVAGPLACQQQRRAATEARLGEARGEAAIESGRAAVETVSEAGRRERISEELTRTNEEEIRHAEGADAPVAGGVRDAGLDSLCRRAAYRDHERCRMRQPAAR